MDTLLVAGWLLFAEAWNHWVEDAANQENQEPDDTDTAVDQLIQEGEDTLGLGAEAQHPDGDTGDKIKSNTLKEGGTMRCLLHEGSEISGTTNVVDKRLSFLQMRNKQGSFHSDISSLSTSSISSSIETLLESRRTDPEEILLSLGFGGNPEPLDPLARIPKRFLKPSQVKGNSLQEFIKHQEEMLETLDTGFCGYRGLSGFLKERQQPVGIVGKILQKIKDNDREVRRSASSPTSTMTSFSEVAFSVMAFNFFRNSLARNQQQHSILEPANREFLDQQSKKKLGNRPRRVILGRDEFSVSHDGSLVHSGKLDRLPLRRRNTALILDDDDTVSESTCFSSDMVSGLDDDESESKAEVEVFQEESAPTESPITKKTFGLWNVCRNVNIRNLATVEEAKMTASKNVSNSCKNEPEINENEIVAGRSARHLMRQHSICDDRSGDESSNKEAKIEPIVDTAAKNKLSKCVESFELEELPTLSDSPERQESPGASIEVAEEPELARIGSAQSDSSGFLDGEAMDPTSDDNLTSDCKVGDYKINESLQSIRKQRDLLPSCTFSCIETADLPSATSVSILKPEPVRPNFTEGFRLLKQPNVPCEIAQNLLSDKLQQSESLFTNNEHACRNFSTVFSDETSSNISNIDQLENQEADEASSSETDPLSENAVKASIIQLLITDNDENKVIVSELIPIDQCSNIDSSDIDTIKYSSESNSLSEDFGNDSIHSFLSNDVLPSCHSLVNNNSSMNNDNMEVEFDSLQEGNKDVISGEGECTNIKEPLSVHSYLTNVNSQTSCNNIEINESNTDIEEVKANSAISEGPNKDERDYDDDQENIVELVTSSDEQKSQLDIKNIDECNDFANITSNEELTNLIVKLSTNNEVQHSFETSIVSKESVPILNQNEKALNKLLDKVTVCAKEDSEIGIKNEGESSCIKSDSVISVVDDSVSISTEPLNKDQLNVSSESLPVSKDLSRKPNEASDSVAKKSSKIASNSHSKQGKPEISNTNYLLPDKVPLRKKGRRHERPHSQEIGKTSYSSYVNVRRLSMEHIPSNFTGLNVVRMLTEDVRSEKKKTDQDGNLQRSRKHSLVTKIVSSELVLSPRSSPIPYSDEIEKYENLKDLLHLVSSDPNETQLSFEEFQAMPSEQKVKVEAYALKQALEKYHQTLYNEEYKDRNQSLTVSLTEDQRHEIEILHKLRQAVRQEVVQAQALLTSRIKVLEKSKEGSTCSQLSYSVNLIRQMVFLLQQQTSLCLRLEQMHIQDKSSSESLAIPGTRDVSYSDRSRPRDYESSTVTMKMQHTLQKFEDNLLEEVRKTVREELNESHKEITELKSMLKNISCLLSNNSSSLHKENQDENILMSCQVPAIHSTEENTHKKQTSSTKQKVAERSMSLPFISQFEFKPIRAPPDEKSFLAHKTVGTDIASNQDEKPNTSKLDLVRVKNKEENLENNNGESDSKTKLHKRKLSPRGPIPPFHTSTFFFPE